MPGFLNSPELEIHDVQKIKWLLYFYCILEEMHFITIAFPFIKEFYKQNKETHFDINVTIRRELRH